MKTFLRLAARADFQPIDVPIGYSCEKLYEDNKDRYENPILLAKINNKYKELLSKPFTAAEILLKNNSESALSYLNEMD